MSSVFEEAQKLWDECDEIIARGPFIVRNPDGSVNEEATRAYNEEYRRYSGQS